MSMSSGDSIAGDGDQDLLLDEEEELDFYAILNVPRDATEEEITKSYRRRCLIFHPDRHTDEEDKRSAEKVFVQLRRAHETLVDVKKRAIYDELGLKGLDAQGWELVSKASNPENIKKEYEFLQRLRENEIMLTRTHPTVISFYFVSKKNNVFLSSFVVKSSLAGIFHEKEDDRFPPQLLGMAITQSVDCALTNSHRIGLAGRVKAENGRGAGNVGISWKGNVGKSNFENNLTLSGDAVTAQCRIARSIFTRAAIIIQPGLQYLYMQGVIMPNLQLIYSARLRLRWQGSIILTLTPVQSSITTTIVHTENNLPKAVANLTLSPSNPNLRILYIKRDSIQDSNIEYACTFGMFGLSPSINIDRKLSRYSRFGIGLNLSLPSCLLVARFKIKSGHSLFEWQVALCDDKDEIARSTLFGVIVPVVTFQLCKIIFRPVWERFISVFDDRTLEREVDLAKQEESQRIINLMRNTAERIKREEEARTGLIIEEGRYGACSPESSNAYPIPGDRSIDVTVALQAMVNDSQLRIHSFNKAQMPGFYDPCPCDPKVLHIRYRFRGEMHAVTVPDDMPVIIPVQRHKINMTS